MDDPTPDLPTRVGSSPGVSRFAGRATLWIALPLCAASCTVSVNPEPGASGDSGATSSADGGTRPGDVDGSGGSDTEGGGESGSTATGGPGGGPAVIPTCEASPVAGQFHDLSVGTPVDIDLHSLCDDADGFAVVGTSRAWDEALLPDGLTFDAGTGRISGTPTTAGQVGVIKLRAFSGAHDYAASWDARSASSTNREYFPDQASVRDISGHEAMLGVPEFSTWDTVHHRNGDGSLKQILPAGVGGTESAVWMLPTQQQDPPWDSPGGFGAGEEFFVQFQMRVDRAFVQWPWDSTPKITILDMLPNDFWHNGGGPTANDWEIVTIVDDGFLSGYFNGPAGVASHEQSILGWDAFGALSTDHNGNDFNNQPAVDRGPDRLNGVDPGLPSGLADGNRPGQPWTAWHQDRARYGALWQYSSPEGNPDGLPDPLAGGVAFAFEAWHTVLQRVTVGQPGDGGIPIGSGGPIEGSIETWIAHDGQDYVKVLDVPAYNTRGSTSPPYWRRAQGDEGQDTCFEAVWFMNLAYESDGTGKPETTWWIDEVIVSQDFIPAPGVGDATGNYRSTDVLLTFRVGG